MSDPNINHLNRVSEAMIIPNIIQFLQIEGDTVAGATLRGGINFKHASGSTSGGEAIYFTGGDSAGGDLTDIQLVFNAVLEDLEDVTTVGAAAGHMMVYNDANGKYHSRPITGHATVGTGGVVTLSVEVVGITNLNVEQMGSSGHILFNDAGGLNFYQPILSHLGDVDNTGVGDAKILIYDGAAGVFKPQNIGTDANLSKAGVLNLRDNSVGTDELFGLTAGLEGYIVGSCGAAGAGGFQWVNKVVNIDDISGPPAGQTGIMFHDGATAFFQTGLNIPSLSTSETAGISLGLAYGAGICGAPAVGGTNLLGVKANDAGSGVQWAWLSAVEIGTGATGIGQLGEISFDGTVKTGDMLVGTGGVFYNRIIGGDIQYSDTSAGSTAHFIIQPGKVTNAMLQTGGGITLATPVGSGLTYSAGGGTNVAGAGVTLGGDHNLQVVVDASTIEIATNTIRVKDVGIVAAKLATDSVTTAKIQNSAVTNDKLAGSIANAKLTGNGTITFTDGTSSTAMALGSTVTIVEDHGINISESSGTFTIAGEVATDSNAGVASFDNTHFTVTSGDVQLKTGGVTAGLIANDAVVAAGIADGAVGLSAMNIKSGEHGASGHVMIRFGDGTNQEVGFVPQSSVTASLVLNDITDVYTGATGAHHVLKVKDGGGGFTTAQLDHSHMANITHNRILGLGGSSPSAPAELTANQVIDIINADGSTDLDANLIPASFVKNTTSNTFTKINTFNYSTDAVRLAGGHLNLAPPVTSGEWAQGMLISPSNVWGGAFGGGYPALGGIGMYGSGGSTDSDRMWIHAEASNGPWTNSGSSIPNITILSSNGYVGINEAAPSYHLDVDGSMHVSGDCFLGTTNHGRVVIGSTTTTLDNTNANFLQIARGADNNGSFLALSHDDSGANNDFGGIFFGTYEDGHPDDGTDSLILGTGLGTSSKIDIRTDGQFRVTDRSVNTVHMSVGTDGQIAMGTGHGTSSNAATTLLHLWEEDTYIWTDSSHEFNTALGKTNRGLIHLDVFSTTDQDGSAGKGGAITFGSHDSAANNVAAGIYVATDGAYGSKMAFATTTQYVDGPQTRMVIDDVGDIGINRNPSSSYKLAIDGGLLATTIEASSNVRCETIEIGNGTSDGIRSKTPADFPGRLYFNESGAVLQYENTGSSSSPNWGPYVACYSNKRFTNTIFFLFFN